MSVNISSVKPSCLIALPSCQEGASSQSFIQCFTLTHSVFNVQLATPGGRTPQFINQDEQSRRWLNDFQTKPFSVPLNLEVIDPNRYTCLLIPHSPGAAVDLANNKDLGQIVSQFIKEKKLICAIGMGVAGLLAARSDDNSTWDLNNYNMTGSSVFELSRLESFGELAVVPEDAVRDCGGAFTASQPDAVHVVVDRHLVTGQNEASTLTAVQNLVLLCNQRHSRNSVKQ